MPRPSVLPALAAAGLAVAVALPMALTTGVLPALAAEPGTPDPQSRQAWLAAADVARSASGGRSEASQSEAAGSTTSGVRLSGQRQLSQRVVARAAAARAAAEQAAAQAAAAQAAAEALAAREAAAERASRAARDADPRRVARSMLAERGQGEQFGCLDRLWTKESEWRVDADNPTSSAYGIPQALPGKKMASAGADWKTNPATQIRWGLGYIAEVYGGPCAAWKHS